jgi:ribose transport system permease protein
MRPTRAVIGRILGTEGLAILLGVVLVSAYFALTVPSFVDADALRYYLNEDVPLFIVTAGLAFVIIAGGIDLSVGSVLGLSAGTSLWASMHGAGPVLSLAVGVGTGLVFGLANGLAVIRLRLNDFIVTLGTLNIGAGLLVVLTDHVQLTGTQDATFLALARTDLGGVTSAMGLAALVVVAVHLILNRTAFGRRARATGMGTEPARVAGIDVDRVKLYAYLLSGGLAGLAGVLLASRLNSVQPGLAGGEELSAIAAAVLGGVSLAGGRGGIWQAAFGALLLITLKQGFRLIGIDPLVFTIITGLCILVGVVADRGVRSLAASVSTSAPIPPRGRLAADKGGRA